MPNEKRELPTIEEHAAARGLESWIYAGVKARNDWPVGKRVSDAAFDKAVKDWLHGPTCAEVQS